MKTTLDLPPDLVKQLKLRAVHEGKKLKEAVADVLRAGLAADGPNARRRASSDPPALNTLPKTLPRLKVRPIERPDGAAPDSPDPQRLVELIKEAEQQDDVARHDRTFGHQHLDRADR